jgi:hypothetical protein
MLILNPKKVTFAGAAWPNVTALTIDRTASRLTIGHTDAGPHPTFADAPEQRTGIKVMVELDQGDVNAPRPGDQGTLTFVTSPTPTDAARRRVTLTGVITNVTHELSTKRGALRTIDLIAISTNAAADPISVTDAGSAP